MTIGEEIEKILSGEPNKINIKRLKEITGEIMPQFVDDIFLKSDTCFCSLSQRKKYKKNFEDYYRRFFQ